jgi:glycosyltransferase involved in cell wall biosynthesis
MALPLTVFVPAYNAGKTIGGVLDRIPQEAWDSIEAVIVVDDGSGDNTGPVVEYRKKRYPKLDLHSFPTNRGYGEAVRQGLTLACRRNSPYIACLHADGQYPPEALLQFVGHMQRYGVDVLQGSRHKSGGAIAGGMPRYKYLAGNCLTRLENAVFGLGLSDYHSGFLVYSRRAVLSVPLEKLSGYFDFDLEFIAYARRRGLVIDELPIPTHYGDESSYLNPIVYGFKALGVMWKYGTGRYDP